MANSVDPDQTLYSVASNLGLHCVLRPGPVLMVIMVAKDMSDSNLKHFLHKIRPNISSGDYACKILNSIFMGKYHHFVILTLPSEN